MSRDRIDELAAELFAAAREEGPDRGLVERVQRVTATGARGAASKGTSGASQQAGAPSGPRPLDRGRERRVERARSPWLLRGLLAAIVFGGAAALLLLPVARDGVIISAERAASGARAASGVATTEGTSAEREGAPAHADEAQPAEARADDGHAGDSRARELHAEGIAAPLETPASASAAGSAGRSARPPEAARVQAAAASATERRLSPEAPPASAPTPRAGKPATASPNPATNALAPGATPAAASDSSQSLANELGALEQIRQALRRRDGAGALALLDRYDTGQFGKRLSLEASVLRVEALDATGRRSEAETLARRFVRDNPDSPLAERAQSFIERVEPARADPVRAQPGSPPR